MQETLDSKMLQFIKGYWMIIIFIGGLIVTWTNFSNSLAQNRVALDESKSEIAVLKEHQTSIDFAQTQILTQLSQIQTDLTWIKTRIK